jgi:hypothetical protein
MEKLTPSYTVGGHINGIANLERVWQLFKKLNTALAYDPAILLLGIHQMKHTATQKLVQKCP